MIVRVDLATRAVTVVRRDIDALALTIGQSAQGKRLFAGSARDNTVLSYGINSDGTLASDETVEIKLDEISTAQDKRPRVLRIDGQGRLYIRASPFD